MQLTEQRSGRPKPIEPQFGAAAVKTFTRHEGHQDRLCSHFDELGDREALISLGAKGQHLYLLAVWISEALLHDRAPTLLDHTNLTDCSLLHLPILREIPGHGEIAPAENGLG
jgi:hypothetical protein